MTKARPIDRRALFASGAAAALLAASGLSAQAIPQRGGRLRVALSGADRADRFDTRQPHGLFMQVAMAGMVFDTMTEIAADGTLRGELATRWQSAPDAKSWLFDLHKEVSFHNGQAFGPADVMASYALHEKDLLADVLQVVPVGANRVRIDLAKGDPDFPYRLSHPRLVIYPAGAIAEAMEQGIGTGLYRVTRFQPGRAVLAERVAQHYKDGLAGWFDEVELVGLSSDAVRAEALSKHYVDAADLTHAADLDDTSTITMLPEEHFMTTAVDHRVALPGQIGTRWPMDNLRAAERWWMA